MGEGRLPYKRTGMLVFFLGGGGGVKNAVLVRLVFSLEGSTAGAFAGPFRLFEPKNYFVLEAVIKNVKPCPQNTILVPLISDQHPGPLYMGVSSVPRVSTGCCAASASAFSYSTERQ